MKRQLPIIIVFVTALFVMVTKFFDLGTFSKTAQDELNLWITVSSVFAFLLGPINLVRLHWSNVEKKRPNWVYSAILLVVLVISTIIMFVDGVNGKVSLFIVDKIANRIDSAIYAMLGFYVCSAAYRSFKLKNTEASILLISAVILMLGQAPIGDAIIPNTSKLAEWILTVPNSAGMRGIRIGASIGAFAASIRVILGLERSWTGTGS
ncbi:MAG TPA: hypothetical protein GXX30_02530 [Firmicutes bacterium]|uniref:Uncharacterized protein n=1 Tax=Candidatus Fermentithermobacillus carboniphilus TaxID=3085328 RepID=A0AAT9LFF2_9FIRM|nr:MAG: hypothetical protein IMF26_05300 [Candidatus Fermentithermobacillus carboniphilus]HHW17763.1 hypothetical protein [Candidatus Fermentithermobacillaceae bacterium]